MKTTVRTTLSQLTLFALISTSTPLIYAETLISIDPAQQTALGIKSETFAAVESAWNTPQPAKVMVPNSQLRVIGAPLSGLLEALNVAEGETVTKGQTLAIIHSPQLLEKQSTYLEALTDLNLASTERKRDEQLSREGIIAERRFLESSAKYTQAKTRAEQYRQSLKLSGMSDTEISRLKKTQKLNPTLEIKAPLSGVVLEQLTTPGSQVNALDPIYKVGYLKPLWLEIHVPLEQLGAVKTGTLVKVAEPESTGKVITVGRMVHGADQGVLIRAEVNDGAEQLRPGQFVQVQIADSGKRDAKSFRIPRSALVRNEGKTWIFVARDNGFSALDITIVKEEASHLVINGQLSTETAVVTSGTAALKAAWLEGGE